MESYSNHCLCSHLYLHSIDDWYRFLYLGQKMRKDKYSCTRVKYGAKNNVKVLEKCAKKRIGHSRLAFNNHKSNIDC